MICAGLDVGALWTKAVVMQDGQIAGWLVTPSSGDTKKAAEDTLTKALEPLAATIGDVPDIVATGAGKQEVTFAKSQATEVLCAAKGMGFLHPEARGVIDLGGESTRAVKLDQAGVVLEFTLNDKCAAGTGVFLDAMAKVMGVAVEDMGPQSLESTAEVNITSMCVAFAESEVVSQVHRQTPKRDILKGIHKSIATRIFGMMRRINLEGKIVAIGGLALNIGILTWLEEMMNDKLIVPENPQIVSALGAAQLAAGH
jgi:predicted CoA-substrate-specific enzyme activase